MKMLRKILKSQRGFSLVELIVALAILGVVVISFTLIFTTSFSGIFRAGHKSRALFETQDKMDNIIAEGQSLGIENLTIKFDYIDIVVVGEVKEVIYEYEGRSGTLYYFLPK